MKQTKLNCSLIQYTPNPDKVVAAAARVCYSSKEIDDIIKDFNDLFNTNENKLVNKLAEMHHESPLEHVSFTFGIEGVSRALSHQLVRHRIASYSQRSQRYVSESDFEVIIPESIKHNKDALAAYETIIDETNTFYNKLIELGIPKEDARYILPNATSTTIIVTMNARSLLNFFAHRCCLRAQEEIRTLAYAMLKLVKEVAPCIFKKAGPNCIYLGYCPEGNMQCKAKLKPTLKELTESKQGK